MLSSDMCLSVCLSAADQSVRPEYNFSKTVKAVDFKFGEHDPKVTKMHLNYYRIKIHLTLA